MAGNKNALIRYKILDNCFRNHGRKYFIEDLIREVDSVLLELDPNSDGISRRQIFDDISFMESKQGWEIDLDKVREGKKVFYRYTNPQFSINNMPLTEDEINQLQSAIDTLSHFTGMPQFDWVNELIPKLKQRIAPKTGNAAIIEFDHNPYLKGIHFLSVLHNAIIYKKVLKVEYQPFQNKTSQTVTIHPYFLKQYNNRWFLFGMNPEKKKNDWNLAVDRMISIAETKDKYEEYSKARWTEYFEDIIGVTKPENEEVEEIVLHFYGVTGNYIETKPLHGSQKVKWIDSNTLEVRLSLIINYEFERLVLSYADSVRVLMPQKLKSTIKNRIKQTIKYY